MKAILAIAALALVGAVAQANEPTATAPAAAPAAATAPAAAPTEGAVATSGKKAHKMGKKKHKKHGEEKAD